MKKPKPAYIPGQESYSLTWGDKFASLNDVWSAGGWRKRKALKDSFATFFFACSYQKYKNKPPIIKGTYSVQLYYSNRVDVDNASIVVKVFLDFARRHGIVEEDNPDYWMSMTITYAPRIGSDKEKLTTIVITPFDYESGILTEGS